MKILCVGDVHWSQNSSILRSNGSTFSTRLENLIKSVNWAEVLAWNSGCAAIVYLGDFFDSAHLNNQEISALKEIMWAPINHFFIVGNHEITRLNNDYSTTDIFNLCPNSRVFSSPEILLTPDHQIELAFLPYLRSEEDHILTKHFAISDKPRIIFSHNDLKNVQYGMFLSEEGFEINDILSNCNLFMNGHIHNCGVIVNNRVINVGNLTGQNFTENSFKQDHPHTVAIIDTDNFSVNYFANPEALNFYKLDTFNGLCQSDIDELFNNAVLSVKTTTAQLNDVKNLLEENKQRGTILTYRLTIEDENVVQDVGTHDLLIETDHLKQFQDYVYTNIGTSDLIRSELESILKG